MTVPRLGLRTRLFLSAIVLVAFFAATSGWWFSGQLRQMLVDEVEVYLESHARTLAQVAPDEPSAEMAELVQAYAEATDARVSVVALDGVVLADSQADASGMDNHGSRPEIRVALERGQGRSIRHSNTIEIDMLYVAVAWPPQKPERVVRMARPLTEVESNVRRLQRVLWVAGLGGLFVTLMAAAAFSQIVTRDLRDLTVRARSLARPPGSVQGDEIARISGSIDRLADELSRAVDDVAEERNRLQAVLSGMREAVVAVDGEGRVEITNPAARTLFGIRSSAAGQKLVEAVGSPVLVRLVSGVVASGMADSSDVRWADERDPTRTLNLKVTVTPQASGGAVMVVHDVSELRRLEAIRRDFVANVSHELRTPVAVIQSSAEALLEGAVGDPEHGPQFASAISRHALRLGALISDLLDLAKIESGRQGLELSDVNVRMAAAEALDPLVGKAEETGHELEVDVPDDLVIRADAVALQQILVNLVDNAIKYTPEGSHIAIEAEPLESGEVEIAVVDDGPGIADRHHDRIFERFYRVDPGRSRDMGGTGLGLAIVRHLTEVQGGTIRVEHNLPQGARFVLRMPPAG